MKNNKGHRLERWWGLDHIFRHGSVEENRREKERSTAWKRAVNLLQGTEIAEIAIKEEWAVGLIDFVQQEGRIPEIDEQEDVMRKTLSNNVDARDFEGPLAPMIQKLRRGMHEKAARVLSVEI